MTSKFNNSVSLGANLCNLLRPGRSAATDLAIAASRHSVPAAELAAPVDLSTKLTQEVGRMGTVTESIDGFRITTDKPLAFPFGQILIVLTSRNFQVSVSRGSDMLVIDARL